MFLRGCLGRLVVLALLAVLAFVVWQQRDQIRFAWDGFRGRGTDISPELAARADEKLASLSEPGGEERVALNAPELQSLMEYRWGGLLPPDVGSPRVGLANGRVTLEANVATSRFGRIAELRDIIAILPDTTGLRAVGSFVPLDDGQVGLEVHEMSAANIPVPRQLIPTVLSRFPGAGDGGLPPNALAIPLPPGIRAVFVSGDSMVFVANRTRGG